MPKFNPIELSKIEAKHGYAFNCPACGHAHYIQTNPEFKPCWTFNGDTDYPTVTPSIRVRSNYSGQHPKSVCHCFIKDGKIQYLDDCTHALAGQIVELPEWT